MIENDRKFLCPYCGVTICTRLDITGGKRQEFIQDCETCCRPIRIRVEFASGEILDFIAEPED